MDRKDGLWGYPETMFANGSLRLTVKCQKFSNLGRSASNASEASWHVGGLFMVLNEWWHI